MSMRRSFRCFVATVLLVLAGNAAPRCEAARIEAVRGKTYGLTKQHGPWMIMVASFHSTEQSTESAEPKGQTKSTEQVANDLVYELRSRGVPAYTHSIENASDLIPTTNRQGQAVRRHNLRRVRSLCVLAGNYPTFEDERAQKTLEWVKNFKPESLKDSVMYSPTPGRPQLLSGAFLCINPMLTPDEVAARRPVDPLLLQLNSGVRHSLADNRGQYTLLVAHYAGKSVTDMKAQPKMFDFLVDNDLDDAAQQANELVSVLRSPPEQGQRFSNLDAYVWHDRYESIVTVGSFSSPNDPAIQRYMKMFAAEVDRGTGETKPQYLLLQGDQPKVWGFIPTPQVIPVPKVR